MGSTMGIVALVNDYIASGRDDHERGGTIWPSTIGLCPRKAIYIYRGEEPTNPFDPRLLRVFEVGKIFEKFVLNAMHAAGVLTHKPDEPPRVTDLYYSGKLDGVVAQDGRTYIVELKTIHSKAFLYKNLPYDHHVYQTLCYHLLWRKSFTTQLSAPHIVYISKDDLLIDEYVVPLSREAEVQERMDYLVACAEKGELPDRPHDDPHQHWHCWNKKGKRPSCDYFDLCWGEGKE